MSDNEWETTPDWGTSSGVDLADPAGQEPSWEPAAEPASPESPDTTSASGWGDSVDDLDWGTDSDDAPYVPPAQSDVPDWEPVQSDGSFGDDIPVSTSSAPRPSRRKPIIVGAATLALAVAAVVGVNLMSGSGGGHAPETPSAQTSQSQSTTSEPVTATATPSPTTSDLDLMKPFAAELSRVLTERDATGYWDLLEPKTQARLSKSMAQDTIDALPAGASYTAVPREVSIAGNTALVKLDLTTKLGDKTSVRSMKAELYLVDGTWRMHVPDASQ